MNFLLPFVFGLSIANMVMGIGGRNWPAVFGWGSSAVLAAVLMSY